MATVVLIRHGRSTANVAGVLAGWGAGIPLDELGEEQARGVGGRLAGGGLRPVLIATSPLRRCRRTAELVAAAFAPAPPTRVEDGLGECRYGAWTGRPIAELAQDPLWRLVQDRPSGARFPDSPEYAGESLAEMAARAVEAVRRLDAEVDAEHGPQALWLAVSHGDVIKAILADALAVHLDDFQRLQVDPGSVSAIRHADGRVRVLRVNDRGGEMASLAGEPGTLPAGEAVVGGGAG